MKKLAEMGFSYSQYNLAISYQEGIEGDKNPEQAFDWMQKAAEQNYYTAHEELIRYFKEGIGCERNDEKAFDHLKKWAEKGNPYGQLLLAIYYQENESPKEAFDWFKKAAQSGYPQAQYELARCYQDGIGCEINNELAFDWMQKAAQQDYLYAQFDLGLCYLDGRGCPRNDPKAFECFTKLSRQEDRGLGSYGLGLYYDRNNQSFKSIPFYIKGGRKGTQESTEKADKKLQNLYVNPRRTTTSSENRREMNRMKQIGENQALFNNNIPEF